jgi:hypothetical protein
LFVVRATGKMGFGGAIGACLVGLSLRFLLLLVTCFLLRLVPFLFKDLGFSSVQKVGDR